MQDVLTLFFRCRPLPCLLSMLALAPVSVIAAPAAKPVVVAEATLRELAPVYWYTGTELYRGLAAVIVGGLAISTVFTLLLLPGMLRLGESVSVQPQPGDTIAS